MPILKFASGGPQRAAQDALQAVAVSRSKRAVLVGITYPGSGQDLPGCANDMRHQYELLTQHFGFQPENILRLTDAQDSGCDLPTYANITKALENLVRLSKDGDVIYFAYSGHGSHVPDFNGDEEDGQDEVLCPCDHTFIVDDFIGQVSLRKL